MRKQIVTMISLVLIVGLVSRARSQNWQVYSASVLPNLNTPAFASENETNPPDTTSWIIDDPDILGNKLLQFINPVDSVSSKNMWGIDWNMDAATGATIICRVKPIDRSLYERTFEVEYRDGSLRERMFVLSDGQIELDRADLKQTLPSGIDDWHTYRITYQNGNSVVYLDEASTPFMSGTSSSANSTNDLRFGDGSDGNTYGFLLDWFIFDVTGPYAPGEGAIIPDSLFVDMVTSVEGNDEEFVPSDYALMQNYPNPFNPVTTIEFHLPQAGEVSITIYNARGQLVTTLLNARMESGTHRVSFNAENYSSGVYYYRIKTADFISARKMILVK